MAVHIDKAGRHQLAAGINGLPGGLLAQIANGHDAAAEDANVGLVALIAGAVHDAAATNLQIEDACCILARS